MSGRKQESLANTASMVMRSVCLIGRNQVTWDKTNRQSHEAHSRDYSFGYTLCTGNRLKSLVQWNNLRNVCVCVGGGGGGCVCVCVCVCVGGGGGGGGGDCAKLIHVSISYSLRIDQSIWNYWPWNITFTLSFKMNLNTPQFYVDVKANTYLCSLEETRDVNGLLFVKHSSPKTYWQIKAYTYNCEYASTHVFSYSEITWTSIGRASSCRRKSGWVLNQTQWNNLGPDTI